MENALHTRLIMLGAAPETRGSVAALVEAYRGRDLFRRWPADYIATYGDGGWKEEAKLTLGALRAFAARLAQNRRAALHVHVCARTGMWRQAAFVALAQAARLPLVLQLHGGGFEAFYDRASTPVRAAVGLALKHAAWVVVPCESLRAWVRTVARDANVLCLPPLVPESRATGGSRQNVVLFLGRLSAERGVLDLVEAFAQVRASVPDVRLVCAGEGDRGAVARLAARLGLAQALTITGTLGPSGKRALFESAGVLALPSYQEGMPVGLLEAMAAGVPVVATPIGGIPEVVADGVSGFLAAPGDKAALARLLRKVLLDRPLAARIGAAARESVRRRCSPERGFAPLEDLYASLGLRGGEQPDGAAREAGWRQAA